MSQTAFYRSRLVSLFLAIKAFYFLLAIISTFLIQPYNPSIGLILFPKNAPSLSFLDHVLKRLLRPFASWDGAYFLTITLKGYIYEQEHAFFPLLPLLARFIGDIMLRSLASVLSLQTRCLLAGVLISNISHFISVIKLYDLSCFIFNDSYYAFLSATFLTLAPMQAVMSSMYSESLFTCLTIVGLSNYYQRRLGLSAIFWCLACATRSNGIFLPGFFIYDYIHAVRHYPLFKATCRFLRLLILCAISWMGFAAVLLFGKTIYCTSESARPWCFWLLPNIYAFVQEHYWNVALLRYFEIKQIPNFVLATPMTILSICGIYSYFKADWKWTLTAGLTHRNVLIKKRPYHNRALLPHIYLWAFMLGYTLLVVHVQIINRLFTFMPIVSWFQAHLYYMAGGHGTKGRTWQYVHLVSLCTFSIVTSILFFNFYPPA